MGRFSLAQIKSIHVQFNAADARARAVREFLARCTAPKTVDSNPACDISARLRIDAQPPVVALEYGARRATRRGALGLAAQRAPCAPPPAAARQRTPRLDALARLRRARRADTRALRRAAVNGVKDLINCAGLSCQQIIGRVGQRTEEMDTETLLKNNGMAGLKLQSRSRQ